MNKEIKRKIYAIALAGIILAAPKTKAYAEEMDTNPIDIDKAISELVPGYDESNSNINSGNNSSSSVTESNNAQVCYHLYEENPDEIINFVSPTCEYPGVYDAVYHCVKCGNPKIVRETMNSFGHDLGEGHVENSNEYGYDFVRKCQNPNCDYSETEKIKYSDEVINNKEQTQPIDNNYEVPQENKSNNNPDFLMATISLGAIGGSLYLVNKNLKKLDIIDSKKKKGKYLRK